MAAAPLLAIDLGGTKILAALVAGSTVVDSRRIDTPRSGGPEAWLDAAAALAEPWRRRFTHAGIAVTGGVAAGRWYPLNPDTLPVPPGFPLVTAIGSRLGVPAVAANDAQAAAWGEHRFGAGKGADIVFLTISTGIGGGIVVGGRLLSGRRGLAGHAGVTRIATPEGEQLLEQLGSGSALARIAAARGVAADARAVFAAAEDGDGAALSLIDEVISPVARAIANLQLVVDPDLFVIGGGMGLSPLYLERLEAALHRFPDSFRPIVRPAALGENAGLVGIADLAPKMTNAHEGQR